MDQSIRSITLWSISVDKVKQTKYVTLYRY